MRFELKLSEVQYIQKQFHFETLLGVEKRILPILGAEKKLKEKGVILTQEGRPAELSNEYRYLFSAWENMRYTVIRPDDNPRDSFFCVLANEKTILLLQKTGNDVVLELMDFKLDTMDAILYNMGEFDESPATQTPFNISLPVADIAQMLASDGEDHRTVWAGKLGISKEDLTFYIEMMNSDDAFVYLSEDHVGEVGALIKIVKTPRGYCALKHVTPSDSNQERMVMISGGAQTIINSIYVF